MDPCKFLHMNSKELGCFVFFEPPMSWVTIFNHLWKLAWFKSRSWGSWPNLPTRSLRIRTVFYTDSKLWWHICNFVVLNTFRVCKVSRIWCQFFFFFYNVYKFMFDQTALSLKESIYIAQGAGAVTARLRILVLQFVQAQVWSRFQCTLSTAAAAALARRWIDKATIGADLALWASESLDPSHLHHGLSEV